MDSSEEAPVGVTGDVAVEEVHREAAKTVEEELEDLFGAGRSEPGPSTDYTGDLLRAVQQVADELADSIAAYLPPDLAKIIQDNALIFMLALSVACLAILYGIMRARSGRSRRSAVLLVGPQGSGKTTLQYALRGTPLPQGSVTSMQATSLTFPVSHSQGATRAVEVVDVPGHPRMRALLDAYIHCARGVVFVVDSAEFVKQKATTAEQLYDTLAVLAASGARVPLLLACNKTDQGAKAFTQDFIVSQLEKDIVGLRQTRLASLGKDVGQGDDRLCSAGAPFQLAACAVPVTACSVSAKAEDLQGVHTFLVKSLGL